MITLDGVNDKGDAVRLVIDGGEVRALYSDGLAEVFDALGETEINRASHVEPWNFGGWYADMSPSDGPKFLLPEYQVNSVNEFIGRPRGFATRQAALDAERAWLREHQGI